MHSLSDAEVEVSGKKQKVSLHAGDAIGFPAKRLYHRVTKVKSGLRKSLVFWVSRPGKDPPGRFDPPSDDERTDDDAPSGGSTTAGRKRKR